MTTTSATACRDRREAIFLLAAGVLESGEEHDVASHLATGCARCAGALAEAREALSLLPQSLDPVTPPAGVRARLLVRATGVADPADLACSIAALITRRVFSLPTKLEPKEPLSRVRREALEEFVLGDHALAREQWLTAERYYLRAFQLDSTFVLAGWRLGNVRRWMPLRTEPPYPAGLLTLLHEHAAGVSEVDRHLIEAQFKPSGAPRFEQYEKAMHVAGDDANAYLLYGDELFHRGPLAGRSMWEAAEMLKRAVSADSTLAPAWEHLAWARIRLGDAERGRGSAGWRRRVRRGDR